MLGFSPRKVAIARSFLCKEGQFHRSISSLQQIQVANQVLAMISPNSLNDAAVIGDTRRANIQRVSKLPRRRIEDCFSVVTRVVSQKELVSQVQVVDE